MTDSSVKTTSKIKRRGLMLVLSSPSGAGKTTLAQLLMKADKHITISISYTTRNKRPGEINGVHYHFVDRPTFKKLIDEGAFLEWAEVFGEFYGTPKAAVLERLEAGEDVLFDIEWQGNRQLTEMAREDVASVFILPPSKKELLERLRGRGQDSEEVVEYRMKQANSEISHWHEYDYTIINKDLDESLKKLLAILRAERLKKVRRSGVIDFVNSFLNEEAPDIED
jgi:guanylate kinase